MHMTTALPRSGTKPMPLRPYQMLMRQPLAPEHEEVATALEQVTEYIEPIAKIQPLTPLDAATQTPRALAQPQAIVIVESEEDKSEYETHFSQGLAKEDKTQKLANRTLEAEGKGGDKLGKKQRKQLQFNTQGASVMGRETSRAVPVEPMNAVTGTAKEPTPARRAKALTDGRGNNAPSDANLIGKADSRRGKDSGASTGKSSER
ncbi:unnamed protein product [Calypogeia fissa]